MIRSANPPDRLRNFMACRKLRSTLCRKLDAMFETEASMGYSPAVLEVADAPPPTVFR